MTKVQKILLLVMSINLAVSLAVFLRMGDFMQAVLDTPTVEPAKPAATVSLEYDLADYPEWNVNEYGQTYGPDSYDVPPDLIAVTGDSRLKGYVYQSDLDGLIQSRRAAETLSQEPQKMDSLPEDRIALFASDGRTVIGAYQPKEE